MKNLLNLKLLAVSLGLILLLAGTVQGATQDTLRPVADIYDETDEWEETPSTDNDKWLAIDEAESDGDDTYLSESDDNNAYIYRADDWGGDGDPDSVEGCFLIRKAEVFNTFTVAIGRAAAPEAIFTWCGVPDTVTEGTQDYTLFSYMMTTDPCTDAAWTTTSLNSNSYGFGIRYAFGGTAAVGRYTQGYVVVYSSEAEGNPRRNREIRQRLRGEENEEDVGFYARLDPADWRQ